MIRLFLTALLAMFHSNPPIQRCMERRYEEIVQRVTDAQNTHGVPPAVLITVAYMETHLGCDVGEGGNWGAPISPTRRHTAGTSDHAARALARSYVVCGNWYGAVTRFRTGLCTQRPDRRLPYPDSVLSVAQRVSARAGTEMPANWAAPRRRR